MLPLKTINLTNRKDRKLHIKKKFWHFNSSSEVGGYLAIGILSRPARVVTIFPFYLQLHTPNQRDEQQRRRCWGLQEGGFLPFPHGGRARRPPPPHSPRIRSTPPEAIPHHRTTTADRRPSSRTHFHWCTTNFIFRPEVGFLGFLFPSVYAYLFSFPFHI